MNPAHVRQLMVLAGCLHFTQVPAMLLLPRVLDWQAELDRVSPMNRRLIRVVVAGIMLCVLGLGVVVSTCAAEMATTCLGRALSGFLAIFWASRGAAQFLVYARIWPVGWRWAHWCLCALFPTLTLLYGVNLVSQGGGP